MPLRERFCNHCGQVFQPTNGGMRFCRPECALWGRTRKTKSCWLYEGGRIPTGYGKIKVDGRQLYAHRFAWMLTCGEIPSGLFVCHVCDVPNCVRPEHLFLGTNQENQWDDRDKGRQPLQGEAHGNAKVTERLVKYLRTVFVPWDPIFGRAALARRFGLNPTYVSRLVHGQRWRHLKSS